MILYKRATTAIWSRIMHPFDQAFSIDDSSIKKTRRRVFLDIIKIVQKYFTIH